MTVLPRPSGWPRCLPRCIFALKASVPVCVWGGKEVLEGMEHPVVLWLWQVNEWL